MNVQLQPEWTDTVYHGCATCGGTYRMLPLDSWIADFDPWGAPAVMRDGEYIPMATFFDREETDEDYCMLAHVESYIAKNADDNHDWRVQLVSPLRGAEWQRHAPGQWILIHSDMGFA